MSLSMEDLNEKKKRERWLISRQKARESNTSITKNGKRVIDNLGKDKVRIGQQTRNKANKAGSGINSQAGKKKDKEARKYENRTKQDVENEQASWLVSFEDSNSIELVKKFKDILEDKPLNKKVAKKLSKKEQFIIQNKKRILDKEIKEEELIIKRIEKCKTYEEIEYFYRSLTHCQLLYLFTTLKWCNEKYNKIIQMNDSKTKNDLIKDMFLKIKTLILHIEDREIKGIDKELLDIFEKTKELTNDMNSIELQLKSKILPKPMNDFKESHLKADLWQTEVIREINNNHNVLVCAPTSTGKTIIGTYMASRNGNTLFIVPNESVGIQVTGVITNFSNGNYSVITKKFIIENENSSMNIGTPIELENFLLSYNYHFDNIIIDEIHCLNNNSTYEQLEFSNSIKRLIILLSGQFLFLSATLTDESMNNLKVYFENIKNEECKVIKHTERFINLQFRIMNEDKRIESVNPFSQIDLSEITDFKGKNMSITNQDIWDFWEASLDEDEFIPQMKKWLGNGLLDINKIQKLSSKIPIFIQNQFEEDQEYIEDVLEEVGSDNKIIEIDMDNKEELDSILLNLVMELKKNDLLPAIIFQNDIVDCHDIHESLVKILEKEQDIKYPTYYEDKKRKAKEFDKIQSKIDKMADSSSKIKSSSKQDRDSAYKAQEQKREEQKEQINSMRESQYSIDMNVHAPHPEYSCGISQISDDSMRQVRWNMRLKISGYETIFMKGIQRGIGLYTHDMPSINQHIMRKLIMEKNIGLLIADDSLAYGVNLPIRTVIIFYDGTVSSQTILQQIGRAGRRGLDTQGNIIIINVKNNTGKNPVKEILMAQFPTINPYLDKEYFSYTEMIKPFCTFQTKKKSDNYYNILKNIVLDKEFSMIDKSIEDKFISMMNIVFLDNKEEIINYLKKVIILIEKYNVNSPGNSKFICNIPYNRNKNISTILLYIHMPHLVEKFSSIKGISHNETRYIFKLLLCLYDNNEDENTIDEELNESFKKYDLLSDFNEDISLKYSKVLYEHFVQNSVPENKKLMITIKFRLITIEDILKNILKYIDETEYLSIKPLFMNVNTKVEKMIDKCQFL